MRASRLALVLPPLLVAGGVALLLSRCRDASPRSRTEDEIRVRWAAPAEFPSIDADLERHLALYGREPEARWFAAEAFVRIGQPRKGLDAVFEDLSGPADRTAPRRFATILLRHLAEKSGAGPRARLVLAESGDAQAREEIRTFVRGLDGVNPALLPYFKSATLTGGAARRILVEDLRAKDDPDLRLAGATLATGPRDRADVDLLVGSVGAEFRRSRYPTWRHVVRALGASGDERALRALVQERAALPAAAEGEAARVRSTLGVGLALLEQEDSVAALLGGTPRTDESDADGSLYANGLVARLEQGDRRAVARLRALWDARREPLTRLSIAYAVLLADEPPSTEVPVADWLDATRSLGSPLAVALAPLYGWRTGRAETRRELLEGLRTLLSDPEATGPEADGSGGTSAVVLEILRAFVRWPAPA